MRLIYLVMHFVVSKILKYAPQTFLRFDSNVPPQIQNSLLFMVHIHMIYTGFTHFCREISLVAITRFGRHFLAKIGGRRHKNIFEDRGHAIHAPRNFHPQHIGNASAYAINLHATHFDAHAWVPAE